MRFDALTHTHSHFACKASFESISSRRINVSTSEHVMSCFDFLMISFYFAYCCGVWCCGRGVAVAHGVCVWAMDLVMAFVYVSRVRSKGEQQKNEKWILKFGHVTGRLSHLVSQQYRCLECRKSKRSTHLWNVQRNELFSPPSLTNCRTDAFIGTRARPCHEAEECEKRRQREANA